MINDQSFEPRISSGFLKDTTITLFGTSGYLLISFLVTIFYARIFSQAEFGTYGLIMAWATILSVIPNLGINYSQIQMINKLIDDNKKKEYISSSLILSLVNSLIYIIIFASFSSFFKRLFPVDLRGYLLFLFLVAGLMSVQTMMMASLQALRLFKYRAILQIIYGFINLLASYFLIIGLGLKVKGAILATILSISIVSILIIRKLRKNIVKITFKSLKELASFGVPLWFNDLMSVVFFNIDVIIVGYLLGPIKTAIYLVAKKIIQMVSQPLQAIYTTYLPHMTERGSVSFKNASELQNKALRSLSILIGIISLSVVYLRIPIIRIFSSKYISSESLVPILFIYLLFQMLNGLMGTGLVALGQPKKPLQLSIISVGIFVIFSFILTSNYGLIGLCYSMLIASLIGHAINIFWTKKIGIQIKLFNYLIPLLIFISLILSVNFFSNGFLLAILTSLILIFSYKLGLINKADIIMHKKIGSAERI